MMDRADEILNAVISQEFGEDWRTLGDLAGQADAEPKLRRLQQRFPEHEITSWSRDELLANLRRGVWAPIRGDDIPPPIAQAMSVAGMYLGANESIKLAQQAADIQFTDGIIGPQTLEAFNKTNIEEFLSHYQQLLQDALSMNTAPPSENAAQFADYMSKSGESFNQTSNKPAFAQQAQSKTANDTLDAGYAPVLESFNVEAIAKKSTSDIWTIEDQLGYASYAQAIAKMIIDGKAQPPLTISIQAPWGQGKTSLMRMIKHKLEQGLRSASEKTAATTMGEEQELPGTQARLNDLDNWIKKEKQAAEKPDGMLRVNTGTVPCVWFNPLYFQDSKQVWSGLAHAILFQLADKLETQLEKERFWFRLRLTRINTRAIRRDIHKLILERLLPKGLVWFAILLLMLTTQFFTSLPLATFLKTNAWLNAVPVVGAALQWLWSFLHKNKDWALDDKLVKYINEPEYEGDLGLLHLVDHDLDRALELLLGEDGRLVVFIDDLDRCTPATVNDILLAINQFISVQHRKLYFILGMDTHMVAMAIETASEKQAATYNKNRHTSKGYGWRFMEKFVQLPFFIPRIQPAEAKKFLDTLLREIPVPKVEKAAIENLKTQIAGTASLPELQNLVVNFKSEHNVEFIPEVDATVASRLIDITSDQEGETLNKLITAALTDLELNPREMKRFLNIARLLFIRLDGDVDVSSDEHMFKVVRASHLILNWPQCLRWLQGNARSYTVKGVKTDPVESIGSLFNNPSIDNFEKWRNSIKDTWGETVAETIAQPDFYTFTRRIHDNPPNLQDIFKARIF
jgi:lysozyme family protein